MPIFKLLCSATLLVFVVSINVLLAQAPYIQMLQSSNVKYRTPVVPADVIDGKNYTITVPGDYYLMTDLVFKTEQDSLSIITINASNVRLNLNEKSISSAAGCRHLKAIEIAAGLSNVIIQNGAINMVNGLGIVVNAGCNNVVINNLLVSNCECGAIAMEDAIDCIVDNVNISHCLGQQHNMTCGIYLNRCLNCYIQNTYCNTVCNECGDGVGIKLEESNGCTIKKCSVSSIKGVSSTGILLHKTRSCFIEETRSILQKSINGAAYGFCFVDTLCTVVQHCQCQTTTSLTGNAYGFYLSNNNSTCISSCTSRDNTTSDGNGDAYGFLACSSINCNFVQCLAYGNCGGNGPGSLCAGFALDEGSSQCSIRDSRSINNSGSGQTYGIKIGGQQTLAHNCSISHCHIAQNKGVIKQYGIKDFNPDCSTLIHDNVSVGHGKVFTYSPTIVDTGFMNYMFKYQSPEKKANYIILEGDSSNFVNLITDGTFMNISLENK